MESGNEEEKSSAETAHTISKTIQGIQNNQTPSRIASAIENQPSPMGSLVCFQQIIQETPAPNLSISPTGSETKLEVFHRQTLLQSVKTVIVRFPASIGQALIKFPVTLLTFDSVEYFSKSELEHLPEKWSGQRSQIMNQYVRWVEKNYPASKEKRCLKPAIEREYGLLKGEEAVREYLFGEVPENADFPENVISYSEWIDEPESSPDSTTASVAAKKRFLDFINERNPGLREKFWRLQYPDMPLKTEEGIWLNAIFQLRENGEIRIATITCNVEKEINSYLDSGLGNGWKDILRSDRRENVSVYDPLHGMHSYTLQHLQNVLRKHKLPLDALKIPPGFRFPETYVLKFNNQGLQKFPYVLLLSSS